MSDILPVIVNNLQDVGIGLLLFLLAYLSNMAFSIYYNIKVLGESFNGTKMKTSIEKMIVYVIGTALLVIVVTSLPLFADQIGLTLPEEYVNAFSSLTILVIPVYGACKYALSAYSKMKDVINSSTSGNETEGMNGETKVVASNEESTISEENSVDTFASSVSRMATASIVPPVETVSESAMPLVNDIPMSEVNMNVGTQGEEVSAVTATPDKVDYEAMEAEQIITGEEVNTENKNDVNQTETHS